MCGRFKSCHKVSKTRVESQEIIFSSLQDKMTNFSDYVSYHAFFADNLTQSKIDLESQQVKIPQK